MLSKHQMRKKLSLGVIGGIWKISKTNDFYMQTSERWSEIHSKGGQAHSMYVQKHRNEKVYSAALDSKVIKFIWDQVRQRTGDNAQSQGGSVG